jgi:hypothetical protein
MSCGISGMPTSRQFQQRMLNLSGTLVKDHWGLSGKSKAALIVSGDQDFGMSRMYEILMDQVTENKVMVFRDLKEAYKWIENLDGKGMPTSLHHVQLKQLVKMRRGFFYLLYGCGGHGQDVLGYLKSAFT